LRVLVQVTVAGAAHVEVGEAGKPVRLDPPQVGLDEDVDGHAGVVVRNADGGEAAYAEVVELLGVDADVGRIRHRGVFLGLFPVNAVHVPKVAVEAQDGLIWDASCMSSTERIDER